MAMLSPEMQQYKRYNNLYTEKASKVYNYTIDEFEIYDSQWKHESWKTWCKGAGRYDETKKIVERYIEECNKTPENCDLSFVHLVH